MISDTSSLKGKGGKRATIGSWLSLAHPGVVEIMAKAGFEWLVVDMEHTSINLAQAEEMIRVINLCKVAPLVRLSSNEPVQIKRVMDMGAHGIIVPMVNSREEAERAVQAMRYPPRGIRGVGLGRAQGYGTSFDTYRGWLEKDSVIIVQIEHIKAVENLDAILSIPEVDGFIVGPYDLSASLGVPGQFGHPKVVEALDAIQGRIGSHFAGYHVVQPDIALVERRIGEGYRFIAYSVDFLLLGETCRRDYKAIQEQLGRRSE